MWNLINNINRFYASLIVSYPLYLSISEYNIIIMLIHNQLL